MTEKDFNSLWAQIALIEIRKTVDLCKKQETRLEQREDAKSFKDNTHSRYECERSNFRSKTKIKPDDLLDRHKVAALFYVAFVHQEIDTKGKNDFSFLFFNKENKRVHDLDAIATHSIAFDIACGIMESFISSDSKTDPNYKEYVKANGLIEPELICFKAKDSTSYKGEVLKQLIYAQKENKLSVAELAVIFSLIENNTRVHYKLSKPRSANQ